jgi:hypothetical protein
MVGQIYYNKNTKVADAVSTINNKSRGKRYWLHKGVTNRETDGDFGILLSQQTSIIPGRKMDINF